MGEASTKLLSPVRQAWLWSLFKTGIVVYAKLQP